MIIRVEAYQGQTGYNSMISCTLSNVLMKFHNKQKEEKISKEKESKGKK